jgi:colicin import membrane protein
MTRETPYTVPKEPGRWRAITLAAVVHIALLVFLWIGIHWKSDTPASVEAEVWDPQQREAAPAPEPVKEPEPQPPQPVVKAPEPPVVEKPEPPKVDIALEQEKKRKEEERKKKQQDEAERLAKLKEQKEREQKLADQKRLDLEKLEKQKADKAAADKKLADEKKRKQDEAYNQMMAKMRDEDMRRITGVTGTGGSGDAARSQGGRTDSGYAGRVGAKIRSNITFTTPEGLDGNPAVEFEVKLLPDGSIAGIRKLKSSGVPGFDEAVSRAIEKSQPYPKDKNGSVPSSFIGVHRPKDQ